MSVVLNRVPADAEREVTSHMGEMMRTQGLDADLLVVREVALEDGLLPGAALEPVRRWLDGLAADAEARGDLIRRTLSGALASLPARASTVERAVAEQLAAAAELPGRDRPGVRRCTARDRRRPAERRPSARRGACALVRRRRDRRCHAGVADTNRIGSGSVEEHPHRQAGRGRRAARRGRAPLEAVIQAAAERAAERVSAHGANTPPARLCSTASPELARAGGASAGRHGGTGARLAGLRHGARARRG